MANNDHSESKSYSWRAEALVDHELVQIALEGEAGIAIYANVPPRTAVRFAYQLLESALVAGVK